METLDELQSITTGYGRSSSLKYQTYYDLLINDLSDMTGPRRQILQREVISTKQPLLLTMMDLTMKYPMRLQVEIHTWEWIHQVMSFGIFIQLNMFHQCQLGTNFSLDFPSETKVQTHFQRSKPNKDGLVLFIYQHIYTNF